MKVKMSFCPFVVYFVLFIVINVAVKSQMSSNSNSNAFIQGDDVRSYIVDSIPITMAKDFPNKSAGKAQNEEESTTNFNSKTHLKFQPTLLDFKERALGVPHHEKVTIINLHNNKTVHMTSISGNTVHFHSSFFEDKIIPALGNTSFNVVFLGREEGEVESNLFIHTSEGSFKYQVRGLSVQSPYRLRPLSNVRLPLNASFSPLIQMHNPYASPLQLVEVYSSGGEFHLELPSGELEGPRHLWEIPAFLTKPIIRLRFHARAHKNHTAYIRLKVNQSEEVLVVPLEVEVGAACGLYSPDDVLDFGIGGSNDPPTTLKLWLHNSWKKAIKIQNVISTPVSKALRIDFEPVKVPPETDHPTEVAQLTFDWGLALETGHTGGRVVVKSKQSGQKLVIPYTATVLAGGLTYDSQVTRFRSDSSHIPPRTFQLTNNFKLPIAITNVSLQKDALLYFEVRQFEPRILQPGQTTSLFEIVSTVPPSLTLDSTVEIFTNVSTLSVPLLCYDGKLTKVISHGKESQLELGTVGSGTEKQVLFALVNSNPVPVTILSWETSLPSANLTIAGIHNGNATTFLTDQALSQDNETTEERSVGPGQYAVVRLVVRADSQVGEITAPLSMYTEYETVDLSIHLRTEHGSLQVTPDPMIFNNCFPGKLCSEMLRVQSLFSVAMALTAVSGDPRLRFSPITPLLLLPASTTDLGILSFDTGQLPPEANYLAATHNVTGATRWQDTLKLPAHCPDYDLSLLAARYNRYHSLSSHLLNLSLRLDTTEVKEHMFGAKVQLSWPLLTSSLAFPLTQVGNTTRRTLVISNPGTHDHLMVQLVLEHTYPSASSLINSLPQSMRPEVVAGAASTPGEFALDTSQSLYKVSSPQVHRDTWAFLLPPSTNTSVLVTFSPVDSHVSSTTILLRNNLTVLELVQLSGTGAHAQFKFGNRKPGSTTPLLFELTDKHLKDCEREKQRKFPAPNLTVKRSFTARNTGALSISVHGFDISGLACEGFGFRVLNCEPFQLPPNGTRKVDIAFTPDFTLARVQRTLGVWTSESENAANYTLVATLPPFLLGTCSSVLARPTWEPLLYYCAVTFMVFLLVCVLAAAFLESDRALKCALIAMSRDNSSVQPVLDLKSIGTGVGLCSPNVPSSLLSSDKSDTPSVSWSRAPPPPPPTVTSQESSEGVREKMFKLETDNAAVFTSSSSKCAKKKEKVRQRFSDPTDSMPTERRSSWANVFTKPVAVTKPNVHIKPTVSPPPVETCKQTFPEVKRKFCKKTTSSARCLLPIASNSEDTETSSTTTESSHDDGDKEVEVTMALQDCDSANTSAVKTVRTRVGVAKSGEGKRTGAERERERLQGGSASSLELEWEDEEPQAKKSHATNPSGTRNRKSGSKCGKGAETGQSGQANSRGKSGGVSKQGNARAKDKQSLAQKRGVEKQLSQPKPLVLEPPPPPVTVWDDTRASFSDVVARSDSTKHSTEQTTGLPTLQPPATPTAAAPAAVTSTTPTALGPIGSKKTYPGGWDCWSDSVSLAPPPAPAPAHVTNSFFMDTRPPPLMQNTSSWKEQDLLLKIIQAEEQRRQERLRSRPVYQETWSPWSGSAPTAEPSTLWGNDVWAPPPPPDTWAPPGLAPRQPPRLDDPTNSDLDIGMEYDPFRSLSNIWAPHTPHNTNPFWKPPTTNN